MIVLMMLLRAARAPTACQLLLEIGLGGGCWGGETCGLVLEQQRRGRQGNLRRGFFGICLLLAHGGRDLG